MLCSEVKRVVYFFLDETLGEAKRRDFSSHTSLCPDCDARVRVHERLRSIIKAKLEKVRQQVLKKCRAMFERDAEQVDHHTLIRLLEQAENLRDIRAMVACPDRDDTWEVLVVSLRIR